MIFLSAGGRLGIFVLSSEVILHALAIFIFEFTVTTSAFELVGEFVTMVDHVHVSADERMKVIHMGFQLGLYSHI